jgi:hypothetical protein
VRYQPTISRKPVIYAIIDGNYTTCSLHLHLLWKGEWQKYPSNATTHISERLIGLRKTHSSRHLELQFVQKGHRRRGMDSLNNCGCYCSQVRSIRFVCLSVPDYNLFTVLFVGCGRLPRHRNSGRCRYAFLHLSLLYAYEHNEYGQHDQIPSPLVAHFRIFSLAAAMPVAIEFYFGQV